LDAIAPSMMNAARVSANLLELMQTLANHHVLMTTKMDNSSMDATARPTQTVSSQTARAIPATRVAIHHQLTVNTTPIVTAPPMKSAFPAIATSTPTSALLNATPWSSDPTLMDVLAETMLPVYQTLALEATVCQTVLLPNCTVPMVNSASALRMTNASRTSVSATNALPTAPLNQQAF